MLHIIYFRTVLHGYAVSDLTVVYPVTRASGPLLSSLGAIIVLGETISAVGFSVKAMLISPILVDYVGNVLRIPLMLPFAFLDPRLPERRRAQWRVAPVIVILAPLGYVMVLYAVRPAPLSHVAPAREVSMLFAAPLAGTLLGESDRWMGLLGAAAIASDVVALALG